MKRPYQQEPFKGAVQCSRNKMNLKPNKKFYFKLFKREDIFLTSASNLLHKVKAAILNLPSPYDLTPNKQISAIVSY